MALSAKGWLATTRGRGGGLRLVRPPTEIVVGEVVREMEEDFTLVECFSPQGSSCRLDGNCRLKGVLWDALQAYMAVLDGVRLSDLVGPPGGKVAAVPVASIRRTRSTAGR
jgi:Rrf2 family nitric oxide-sensitive transcriptional repressor